MIKLKLVRKKLTMEKEWCREMEQRMQKGKVQNGKNIRTIGKRGEILLNIRKTGKLKHVGEMNGKKVTKMGRRVEKNEKWKRLDKSICKALD